MIIQTIEKLDAYIEEGIDGVEIVRLVAEVVVQQRVEARLEDDGIVDGGHADVVAFVPTRLTSSGRRSVHHVVGNQEEGLKLKQFTR